MSRRSKRTGYTDNTALNKSETSNSLPWSEWSDIELNAEQWDYPKGAPFTDPHPIAMPRSLRTITEWKRFGELDSVVAPVVYEAIPSCPDFTTNNHHLTHSEFIRCFVSTLVNLQYCGRNGLEVENPTSNFSSSSSDQRWQGWFNVYSLNRAGKGIPHRPVFNPNGKYVARIFHMGRWRRILVDDLVPVDETGTPLLPRTSNPNELWPMVLAKALLRVAALSWTANREIVDCSLITCLTGWIDLSFDVSRLSPPDQWELVTKYTKRFERPRDENSSTDQPRLGLLDKLRSRKSKTRLPKLVDVPEDRQPTMLFLTLENARSADGQEVPEITPCWSHQIYVEMSRDVPLDPTQARAPLAKWKNHRWLDWAIRRGLVDASDYFVPFRRLLVFSPLARCTSNTEGEIDADFVEKLAIASVSRSSNAIDAEEAAMENVSLKTSRIDEHRRQDTSIWADFNKLSRYLREIHLFYRRKFFEYSDEIAQTATQSTIDRDRKSDFSTRDVKKIAGGSRESPVIEERSTAEYEEPISRSRNEQLYLFVDSVDEKFFLVNFSIAPWKYNRDDDNSGAFSSVVFERHDTFDDRYYGYECVESMKTKGTKSVVFQLPPGRHLLRILTNFVTNARVVILSDTSFSIGDLSSVHKLMTVEASRIEQAARRIGSSVIGAFEAFGTPDYAIQLKNYYRSYAPDTPREMGTSTMAASSEQRSHRRLRKSIHEWFSQEFFKFTEKRFPPSDLAYVRRSMRVFFLDPSIGATPPITCCDEEEQENRQIDEGEWSTIRRVTIIQSFFRMALIKRYREIHEIDHPEHSRVKETLLRIGRVFRTEHGPHCVLREVVERLQASAKPLYSWQTDLRHVIVIQELRGRINDLTESNNRWIPVVRINVNAAKNARVVASIDLLASLSRCAVRSFDNDALCEMPRLVNNVAPNCYTYRENGYTIFAYGWTNDEAANKGVDWSLRLTTIKGQPTFHSINRMLLFPPVMDMPSPQVRDASNVYVPNPRGRLFRLIARVRSKTLVSLRLSTSYDRVLTRLRVARNDGSVVVENEGGGNLIVPLLFLEYEAPNEVGESPETSNEPRKSSRKHRGSLSDRSGIASRRSSTDGAAVAKSATRYTIEAFVRGDSWPLTEDEWIALTEFTSSEDFGKNRGATKPNDGRRSQRSRHSSKRPLMEFVREPHWNLRIVTDPGSEMDVLPDNSRDELIAELQRLWNADEPGRSKRGEKLRRAFLEDVTRTSAPSSLAYLTNATTTSNAMERIEKIGSSETSAREITKFSSERTLEPPAHLPGHLPKLDLSVYMVMEDEEEDRWVKTEFDEETLRNQRAINVLDSEQLRSAFLEESTRIMKARREKYERTAQMYAEKRENRNRELSEAYEWRRAYVESMRPTSGSVRSKADSKSKKRR